MDVHAYLSEFARPWKKPFLERAAALPAPLAELARDFALDEKPRHELNGALAELLHTGDEPVLDAVATQFFPGFARTARQTIAALLERHPYPQGYQRRGFRAPGHRLQADSAAQWVWQTWWATREYPQDLEWFAVHAGLLQSWQSHRLGLLLAEAVSQSEGDVLQILSDTASSQHPVARMGRHVPLALLASTRVEAWTLAEGLLLAAQRQEGLRQVILECVDEAHPEAFTRTLRLILQEDLLRFAATLRAADVWFGLGYDVTDVRAVRALLTRALGFLNDPEQARQVATAGSADLSGPDTHLALYTLAMRDAPEAARVARALAHDPVPDRRMAAAHFLVSSGLQEGADERWLLDDPDPRIGAVLTGNTGMLQPAIRRVAEGDTTGLTFEALERYASRLGTQAAHSPLLFPWLGQTPARAEVLDVLPALLGERPFAALAPHLPQMSVYGKVATLRAMEKHAQTAPLDAASRELLMALLLDRNSSVSEEAVKVAAHLTLEPAEVETVHGLLTRKSADLRRGLIRLLARDPQQASLSATALLARRNTDQRQAGLQLLLETGGGAPEAFTPGNTSEETLYARIVAPQQALTLDNGLGLFDPQALAPLPTLTPHPHDYPAEVRRGAELLASLDRLIHEHRERPLVSEGWDGQETGLLGNVQAWQLRPANGTSAAGTPEAMPLADLWLGWWERRPAPQPGDLTRLRWALNHYVARRSEQDQGAPEQEDWEEPGVPAAPIDPVQQLRIQTLHRMFGPLVPLWLEYARLIPPVLHFLDEQADETDIDLALDAWETGLSYLPPDAELLPDSKYTWRSTDPRELLSGVRPRTPLGGWTREQQHRFWSLSVYNDRAFAGLPRERPDTPLLLLATQHGWAGRPDLYDSLIGPRARQNGYSYSGGRFGQLSDYTRRRLREHQPVSPEWLQAVNDVRERVLEVEMARGDLETPATPAALSLQSVAGGEVPLRLLSGLGKNPLKRGYTGSNQSRDTTFSHLIRVSFPTADETPASFAAQVKALGLPDARLLDLAMFAPQWAPLVAATLGWKGLQDAVYWMHAHTRDSSWSVPQEVRDAWVAEIGERTPLGAAELTEGAVDVAWFRRMYARLGRERFSILLGAARYASSSGGHKRAELFAQAILGQADETELRRRISEKRHQDAVRALGLLPLAKRAAASAKQLESRYRVLSEFRRSARQFGAQRQASERLAADIGMQNLARTAGYADPQRLMWAMEARMAPDWQSVAELDGVSVGIELTPDGVASLRVQRGEKALKALPATLRKHPEVLALKLAVSELEATRKRMRSALEEAMVRGDLFQAGELRALAAHPVIAPMLRACVWVAGEQHLGWWQGDELGTPAGVLPLHDEALRLAHPHDLYTGGQWLDFQRQVVAQGLAQPFKQVFREYYPLTAAEQEARRSQRYDGHHVQPTQASALFKARGWVTVPEEGVRKTFHAEGLNVWVDTALGYGTPGEVEGTPLGAVYFVERDGTEAMPLAAVPPRVFSETMRDLDLVVSVAHVGGVDPEASQSTVEMRTSLLRETLRLLRLDNVRLEHTHALIEGHHSSYSVHLGSGAVHRMPGGFLCIIPVHNQHQGRLFLPFADPDPRTAEVVSKVLLLARDREIQDPTILEQLV